MAHCYVGQQEHALLHKNVAKFHSTEDDPHIYYARINEFITYLEICSLSYMHNRHPQAKYNNLYWLDRNNFLYLCLSVCLSACICVCVSLCVCVCVCV